ncbi:nuclear transport factor 2 family protein [Paractinoplanes hotanensis]|uniref:Nuclear transport factor 2 family protein n=1 Tax=Paractinoplanes hotanensis TaxID=2906497 RepID=A0ABT0YBY8_9ACTN|nr:nuclear transport factor 2 family protein [Actinoplanes hotanensis]MCM4083561.1 nuclear transport factor 2 family protein [Actinoplanes hotanensis]
MDTTASRGANLSWDELPTAITTYLPAHQEHATETAIGPFAADAVVTDEGQTYHGRAQIRGWLDKSAGEYTYTTEFAGASRDGGTGWDVIQHLEGDFPGGEVDLHYRFTLDGDHISRLVIEP